MVIDMLTCSIQPKTNLIVDWSVKMKEPEGSLICEYDTSTIPFRLYSKLNNMWIKTGYTKIEDLENIGVDIVWKPTEVKSNA